ncbi:DUF805 domain-containing protein [Pseudomonas sp. MAFF 730085]|uniref:DUF805 domain-containing protein n=1 Tax=Pseudomonas kitaguniensis TaxID=2607908 RepID=A0A5N7JTK4_9PSED|nr:DUF805 domain-containing protein [Pseudomonas kitaguniensis]MPQ84727.1 DUF805 domain-containing protein [Pseudomonas kitaguniensis]MPR05050.1 DUF805 domain-containing protein [Pseudomonas kitaguniensis]
MSDNRFKIVFDGALLPGVESTTAKLNLAELFKCDVQAIERLFTGSTVALKRDLSSADADTYLLALKNAGVDARIEPEQPLTFSLDKTNETAPAAADFANPSASPYAPPRAAVGDHTAEFSTLKVFTTHGRIGRLRYLAWTLVMSVAMLVASGIISTASFAVATASPTAGTILGVLLGLALFVALVCVSVQIGVQRLHDLGWSGWLYLLNLVPLVNSIFPLLLLVLPGNTGANQYGPPPPRNSKAVKVLAALWLAFIPVILAIALALGMNGYFDQLEANLGNRYESSSITSDDAADQSANVDEEDVQSADDTAEPVDSPEQ